MSQKTLLYAFYVALLCKRRKHSDGKRPGSLWGTSGRLGALFASRLNPAYLKCSRLARTDGQKERRDHCLNAKPSLPKVVGI